MAHFIFLLLGSESETYELLHICQTLLDFSPPVPLRPVTLSLFLPIQIITMEIFIRVGAPREFPYENNETEIVEAAARKEIVFHHKRNDVFNICGHCRAVHRINSCVPLPLLCK